MAAILSLTEYKTLRGITDTDRDNSLTMALAGAEDAVLRYTGRDFTTAETVQTKTYTYNGSGILAVDDVVTVSALTVNDATVTDDYYFLGPAADGPPYSLIEIDACGFGSPLMGFTRNLDTLMPWRRRRGRAAVTGTFGWPGAAPGSVKMAVAYLVDEFAPEHAGDSTGLQAEGIDSYNVVYQAAEADQTGEDRLPPRVEQLLSNFIRPRF